MKSLLLAGGMLSLLCAVAAAQGPAEMALYEKLSKGPNSTQALETVLKKADGYSAIVLFAGAGVAFKEKRLEESAFLFYAAQLRARFDKECFVPQAGGANDPFLAVAAVSQDLGSVINPAVMADPKAFAGAHARLKEWNPQAPADYSPGYEYTARKTAAEAQAAVRTSRTEFLARMGDLSTLLGDAEYFAAFRTLQAYNSGDGRNRPSEAANEKALETMLRIEKARKLRGVMSE